MPFSGAGERSERQAEHACVPHFVAHVAVHLASATPLRVGGEVDALGIAPATYRVCHVHEDGGDTASAILLVDDDVLDPVFATDQDDHRAQQYRADDLVVVECDEQLGSAVEHAG